MRITRKFSGIAALALAAALTGPEPSAAYNMMQIANSGWVDRDVNSVACTSRLGFMHWNTLNIDWYLNTSGQGAGKQTAIQAAITTWNNVSNSDYTLRYAGTWNGGFEVQDGRNTISWGINAVCDSASCHAITGLLLQAPTTTPNGQAILETDILFNANPNRNFQWMTNGQYSPSCWQTPGSTGLMIDTQGIATHELGHSFGIGHPGTQDTSPSAPTMGLAACTTDGRTLAGDDIDALVCSENRYPFNPFYDGDLEKLECRSITGWAYNANRETQPSYVEFVEAMSNGTIRPFNAVAANRFQRLGFAHGFNYTPSSADKIFDGKWHSVRVRHTGTGEELGRRDLICGLELFPQSMNPADPYLSTNGLPYEVATQLESSQPGYITALGYFFAPTEGDAGPHTIRLWSDANPSTPLASVSISPPVILGKIGWSYATLPTRIPIQAGARYRVSINTHANQSKSSCGSANSLLGGYTNSPLTAIQGFWAPGSGVFPTNSSCSNFFVSARFEM